jgi:hypothetical protein
MTAADWLVILALLGTALAGMAWVASTPGGTRVLVTSDGETRYTAPLDQPRSFAVEGPLGSTHLVIDAQGVRITSSPCPRKICISMGPAKHSGDLLACVPNRIMVLIDNPGGEEAPYDLLSR